MWHPALAKGSHRRRRQACFMLLCNLWLGQVFYQRLDSQSLHSSSWSQRCLLCTTWEGAHSSALPCTHVHAQAQVCTSLCKCVRENHAAKCSRPGFTTLDAIRITWGALNVLLPRPHSRAMKPESLGIHIRHQYYYKALRWFQYVAGLENHCSRWTQSPGKFHPPTHDFRLSFQAGMELKISDPQAIKPEGKVIFIQQTLLSTNYT